MKAKPLKIVLLTVVSIGAIAGLWFWLIVPHYRPSLEGGEALGIDVSHHQKAINWTKVSHDEIAFAYLKATEGGDHVDSRFAQNLREAKAAGLKIGTYHFFTFCRSGADQAANFLATVGTTLDLPPALDLEYGGNCSKRPPRSQLQHEVDVFITTVEAATHKPVLLYVMDNTEARYKILDTRKNPVWARRYPLHPSNPKWLIWQLHGFANVDGVSGPVDLDVGRIDRLSTLALD